MKTDLSSLLALCSEVRTDRDGFDEAADIKARDEAVNSAKQYAADWFGEDAAATFGDWRALEVMEPGCLQAAVDLTPFAVLRFSRPVDDPRASFTLFGHCASCLHDETATVTNLLTLANALAAVGVR